MKNNPCADLCHSSISNIQDMEFVSKVIPQQNVPPNEFIYLSVTLSLLCIYKQYFNRDSQFSIRWFKWGSVDYLIEIQSQNNLKK